MKECASPATGCGIEWLKGHRVRELAKRERDWVLRVDQGVSIVIWCLWRICQQGEIAVTSDDDSHCPASRIATEILQGSLITSAKIMGGASCPASPRTNTQLKGLVSRVVGSPLDLEITFESGTLLQLVQISSRYESWMVVSPGGRSLAARADAQVSLRSPSLPRLHQREG